jgi:hypothetical protein
MDNEKKPNFINITGSVSIFENLENPPLGR